MNALHVADLRTQHQAWLRERYDGHNRHPVRLPWKTLRHRRQRRLTSAALRGVGRRW